MRTILGLAGASALIALTAFPAQAATWQEINCKYRVVGAHVLALCKRTDYAMQADGDGLRELAVTFVIGGDGCDLLEDHGGFLTRISTTTAYPTFPYLPVASKHLSPQYRCEATKAVGQSGPDQGRMRVVTAVHVRIDGHNDWNPVFAETLCRAEAC